MTIRAGVIGYGLSAKVFHLPFLKALDAFEVKAISTSRVEEAAADWPDARIYADPEAMIADDGLDLIINTAPNHAHFPLSAAALRAGKHVVVEKPFVTRLEDGDALIKLAAENKRVLSIYHNRRWDGDFLTVQKLISEGKLGPVRYFETHFDRFRPVVRDTWRESDGEGSGILFDLGPHLVDQTLTLFGMPKALTAQVMMARAGARSDDMFRLTLHYDGMLAVLVSSPFCAAPNLRYKVEGEAGNYVKYGLDPQEARLREGIQPNGAIWAAEDPADYGQLYTAQGSEPVESVTGGYQGYYYALANSIASGGEPPVTASQALTVLRLLEIARESSETGRTIPLSVPKDA
ncbi:oxidoreductase [Kordiimonas gwangyangensis]|uniref:oxidoreductase n=2 Tax=Kordiimonas gwangyangensis TaxID=288022 RepID=UPI0003A7DF4E|nr:oxidoreductase [Kordiimonas gwangyangensis]